MNHFRYRISVAALVLVTTSVLAGCAAPVPDTPQTPAPAAPPFRPVASIREVMTGIIDPSVDAVWNSVKTVIEGGRMTDHAPATDQDWAEVRRHAVIVSEAANLLLMHDRPVAPSGATASSDVVLAPEKIRELIEQNRDGWYFYVQALQDSLTPALAAIDAKNSQALLDAGEQIDTACENCHQTFWFPNAVAPAR